MTTSTVGAVTTTKGPGTNKAELEAKFWGAGDSARADKIEALINAGFDLSWLLDNVRGGFQWLAPTLSNEQIIPDSEWTPLLLGQAVVDAFDVEWKDDTGTSTITSNSDSDTLPQATINVADLSWLDAPASSAERGFVEISDGTNRQVVMFTGISIGTGASGEDQLTGCTLGSVALSTGDVVTLGSVSIFPTRGPDTGTFLLEMNTIVRFAPSATGYRRVRQTVLGDSLRLGVYYVLPIFGADAPGLNIPGGQDVLCAGQPGFLPTTNAAHVIEVYQTSGGDLNILRGVLDGTLVMQTAFPTPQAAGVAV